MSKSKRRKKGGGAAAPAKPGSAARGGAPKRAAGSKQTAKSKQSPRERGARAAASQQSIAQGITRMHWGIFVVGAILCWGFYGPALHAGTQALGSGIRALLWVGFAYFLVAVVTPGIILLTQAEPGAFTAKGNMIATGAGVLGALGAVCILFAFKNKGLPITVMPLVFGGAPLVNVLTSMILHPPETKPNPLLYLGYAMAAAGGFMVLKFNPSGKPHGKPGAPAAQVKVEGAAPVASPAATPHP